MTRPAARGRRVRRALLTFAYMATGVALMSIPFFLVPFLRDYLDVLIGVGGGYAVWLAVKDYRKDPSEA